MADTILGGDFTVYYSAENGQKRIEWTGPTFGTRTLNQLYSALLKLFDDSAQMDDKIPIQAVTPTQYRMINEWFIDDSTVEHLTGGSLFSQGWKSGTTEHILQIGFDNATAFSAHDVGRTIAGTTTTDTGTLLDFNTSRGLLWIRPDDPLAAGDEFDNATEAYTIQNDPAAQVWSFDDSLTSFVDETTDFNDADANDVATFPAGAGVSDYIAVGFAQRFSKLNIDVGTVGTGTYTVTWEYWNGTAWSALSNVVDGTDSFKTTSINTVTWDIPTRWTREAFNNSQVLYFVRARRDGGTVTQDPLLDEGDIRFDSNQAVITSVAGTGPNYTVQYYLIGNQTDFDNNDVVENELSSKSMTLDATPTDVNPGAAPDSTVTIAFGATTVNINNGNGARPYSILIDPTASKVPIADIYEVLKYRTRRGSTTVLLGQDGEEYVGNELQAQYTSQTGGNFTEGTKLYDQTTNAEGILVADHDDGTSGDVILKAVRGTFTSTNTLSDAPSVSGTIAAALQVDASPFAIADQTAAATVGGGADVTPFPATEATGDYFAIGHTEPFATATIDIATSGTVGTGNWDYWDGTTWADLEAVAGFNDATLDLTANVGPLDVTFPPPLDWTPTTLVDTAAEYGPYYYIRLRVTGAYTVNPVIDEVYVQDDVTATMGALRTIVPVSAAPFGTLAGGSLFGAPGVALVTANLATGEEQSFQLVDDDGVTQVPPNTISVTVGNLISGDSVAVFRRTGTNINKTQFTLTAGNNLGDADILVNENIDADNPTNANSKVRVVSSSGQEHRYRYASYDSGTDTFTLSAASTGSATAGSTLTSIVNAGADFVTDLVEVGDLVRNTTDGFSFSTVVAVTNLTTLVVTDNGVSWSSQAYSVNTLVENYGAGDNAYVPIIERVADNTTESNSLVFSSNIDVRAVVRRSSTATEILPFEQDTTVTGNLTVTAIRNTDDIIT